MGRENPEVYSKSPEFIKVLYDESGKPIGVKPADVKTEETQETRSVTELKTPQYSNDLTVIGKWLSTINANINSLRIAITETNKSRQMDVGIAGILNDMNDRISTLAKEMGTTILSSHRVSEEMILLRNKVDEMKNQLNDVSSIRGQMSSRFLDLEKRLNEIESRISTPDFAPVISQIEQRYRDIESGILAAERQLSMKSDQTNQRIFSLENRVTEFQTINDSFAERINSITVLLEKLAVRMNETREQVEKIEQENGNRFSQFATRNDLEKMKSDLESAIILNRLTYEFMIKDLAKKRKAVRKTVRKVRIKRKVRRIKRKVRRIKKIKRTSFRKIRIEKVLKTRFNLKPDEKILVVSEKRLAKYGRVVHDVARKVNKNSALMVVENRKNQREEFGSTVEKAMKNSDLVLISSKFSVKKTNVYRGLKRAIVRIGFFNRRLMFSK